MKNSVKLLTLNQVEECLQIVIDRINEGKPSYTKKDVMKILKAIYNGLLKTATANSEVGFCLPVEEGEENVTI